MASDWALVAIGGGASAVTAAVTAGVPAWMARRTEKDRLKIDLARFDVEREQHSALMREKRNVEMLALTREIAEQYGSMAQRSNSVEAIGKLHSLVYRGSLELERGGADVCAAWLADLREHGYLEANNHEHLMRLVSTIRMVTHLD